MSVNYSSLRIDQSVLIKISPGLGSNFFRLKVRYNIVSYITSGGRKNIFTTINLFVLDRTGSPICLPVLPFI